MQIETAAGYGICSGMSISTTS